MKPNGDGEGEGSLEEINPLLIKTATNKTIRVISAKKYDIPTHTFTQSYPQFIFHSVKSSKHYNNYYVINGDRHLLSWKLTENPDTVGKPIFLNL